jgi:hypothetical protein
MAPAAAGSLPKANLPVEQSELALAQTPAEKAVAERGEAPAPPTLPCQMPRCPELVPERPEHRMVRLGWRPSLRAQSHFQKPATFDR